MKRFLALLLTLSMVLSMGLSTAMAEEKELLTIDI